jgi:hypothetical protein
MRALFVIALAVWFLGCRSTPQKVTLTPQQATSLAIELANDKSVSSYGFRPFRDGLQPARLVDGRWRWTGLKAFGRGDICAVVEMSADGSTHEIDLQLLDNANLF